MRFEVELVEPRGRVAPPVWRMNRGHSRYPVLALADASTATV